MLTRREWEERQAKYRAYAAWKHANPAPARPLSDIMADIEFLRSMAAPEDLLVDPDPQKEGVAILKRALALLA